MTTAEPIGGGRGPAPKKPERVRSVPPSLIAFGKCFPSAGFRHERAEIVSQPSRIRAETAPYRQNDAATGKIRWAGYLQLTEIIRETDNVKTFRLADPGGGGCGGALCGAALSGCHVDADRAASSIRSSSR